MGLNLTLLPKELLIGTELTQLLQVCLWTGSNFILHYWLTKMPNRPIFLIYHLSWSSQGPTIKNTLDKLGRLSLIYYEGFKGVIFWCQEGFKISYTDIYIYTVCVSVRCASLVLCMNWLWNTLTVWGCELITTVQLQMALTLHTHTCTVHLWVNEKQFKLFKVLSAWRAQRVSGGERHPPPPLCVLKQGR